MKRTVILALAAGALVPFGWWVGGGELVRGPDLARVVATGFSAAVFVFLLMRS